MSCGGKHPGEGKRRVGAQGHAHARFRHPFIILINENLKAGANIDEIMEWFEGLDREQVEAVIEFAARSLDVTPPSPVTC
jgi:Protein of unknown function (DUF433)